MLNRILLLISCVSIYANAAAAAAAAAAASSGGGGSTVVDGVRCGVTVDGVPNITMRYYQAAEGASLDKSGQMAAVVLFSKDASFKDTKIFSSYQVLLSEDTKRALCPVTHEPHFTLFEVNAEDRLKQLIVNVVRISPRLRSKDIDGVTRILLESTDFKELMNIKKEVCKDKAEEENTAARKMIEYFGIMLHIATGDIGRITAECLLKKFYEYMNFNPTTPGESAQKNRLVKLCAAPLMDAMRKAASLLDIDLITKENLYIDRFKGISVLCPKETLDKKIKSSLSYKAEGGSSVIEDAVKAYGLDAINGTQACMAISRSTTLHVSIFKHPNFPKIKSIYEKIGVETIIFKLYKELPSALLVAGGAAAAAAASGGGGTS